jgi:hypothetical protein
MTKQETIASNLLKKYFAGEDIEYGSAKLSSMKIAHIVNAKKYLERLDANPIRKAWIEIFEREIMKGKELKKPEQQNWEAELKKCMESPYYYMTSYVIIDGKPFITCLTEEEFNKFFNRFANNHKGPY